jgi:hypothetical protein
MGLENASSLNNYGMGPRSSIPRVFIDNTIGNNFSAATAATPRPADRGAHGDARARALNATGFTLNDTTATAACRVRLVRVRDRARQRRARVRLARRAPPGRDGRLRAAPRGRDSVMRAGAQRPRLGPATRRDRRHLHDPGDWLAQDGAMTRADFVRLIRSYKARFRAQVARTPAGARGGQLDAGRCRRPERHHDGLPDQHQHQWRLGLRLARPAPHHR